MENLGAPVGLAWSSPSVASASYAKFTFHLDYQDQAATVEVDRWGNVVQANGPSNKTNVASAYGSKVLKSWGHQLRRFLEPGVMEFGPGGSAE